MIRRHLGQSNARDAHGVVKDQTIEHAPVSVIKQPGEKEGHEDRSRDIEQKRARRRINPPKW